jgi:hypothetical protein
MDQIIDTTIESDLPLEINKESIIKKYKWNRCALCFVIFSLPDIIPIILVCNNVNDLNNIYNNKCTCNVRIGLDLLILVLQITDCIITLINTSIHCSNNDSMIMSFNSCNYGMINNVNFNQTCVLNKEKNDIVFQAFNFGRNITVLEVSLVAFGCIFSILIGLFCSLV